MRRQAKSGAGTQVGFGDGEKIVMGVSVGMA
jgi:hypothetical protein